jgi:hypothetical protein
MSNTATTTVTATATSFAFYIAERKGQPKDTWITNYMRFGTREDAERYGSDLMGRWMGAAEGEVRETSDPVNRVRTPKGWESVTA